MNELYQQVKSAVSEQKILPALLIFIVMGLLSGTVEAATDTFASTGTWIAPAGVTSATVEAWGGGGAGGGATGDPAKGGGGAGGQYAKKVVTISPGSSYAVTVGAGGSGSTGNGTVGEDSTFAANVVVAKGGAGGTGAINGIAGTGTSSGGVGDVVYAGGSGSAGSVSSNNCNNGGAGGGGAGSGGAGGSASGNTAGTGTATGGGTGGNGSNSSGSGNSGSVAGGAGAGACAESNTDRTGGNGARGQVWITYDLPPSVTSINTANADPTNAASVSWTVTFSANVTGVSSSNFSLVNSGLGGTPAITGVSGSGTTWTVTASSGTGTGTLGLNMANITGISPTVVPTTFTGQVYTIDRTAPVVSSIALVDPTPTASASVSWAVTFSKSVTGVDAADFALAPADGVSGAAITSVTGSGTAWIVAASTGTGDGTLGLDLADDDSIVDGTSNPLGGTGNSNGDFSGEIYSIVRPASPTVCVDDTSIGTKAWTTLTGPVGSDNAYATASVNDGETTHYLKCTGYGFVIPSDAIIEGITVGVERFAGSTNLRDAAMKIVKSGVIGATDKSNTGTYPTSDPNTYDNHGGATDLWGETWTSADINSSNFGVALASRKSDNNGGSRTISVDHMTISVAYRRPPVNCTSNASSNWTLSTTWTNCRGGIPLAGDQVIILGAHTVTLNTTTPVLGDLTNGGTLNASGSNTLSIGGNFVNNGTVSLGSSNIDLYGNFSNTTGTSFNLGGTDSGTWTFRGTALQNISSTGILTSFPNLVLNNASGLILNASATVKTQLTLTSGHISTGSNMLMLSANCNSPSWSRGSGFVAGNLRLTFPSGTITCTYPVGSDSSYAPISLTMVSTGGTLTGSTTGYEHPAIAFSTIDPTLDANRYWRLGALDDTVTATSYGITVNFQIGDLDINAVPASFIVGKYASGVWTMPASTSGTSSSTASNISGPIAIPTDFAVGQIPEPCTVPSGLPSNMTCVCDNFGRSNLNPSTIYGADWLVDNKNQDSTFGNPRIVNSGRLQLTDNSGGVSTVANVPSTFPAAGNLIVVEFKHYAYHGTGADGIALTLSDSTKMPTPGAFGGSLGYAQKSNPGSDCTTSGGCPGFNGGWVGIAIDEFGNFSANTEGRTGGSAPGQRVDSVAVRGSGSGLTGYPYLGGSATLSPGIDNAGSTAAAYGYQYRVTVDARNYTWNGSTGTKTTTVAVDRDTFTGSGYQPVVPSFDAFIVNPSQDLVPANWKLSFTGSTGSSNNIHEISGLKICAQTITPPAGYRIQVDNLSPSNCTDAANGKSIVTVTALDNSGNTLTGYTSPVTLVARIGSSSGSVSSTATWTSLASNNGVWDAVNKRYTFSANDHGVAKFQLTNSATEDIYIVVSESVSGSTLASTLITPIQFSGGAFSVSALDSLNTGVVAGRPHLMRITRTNGCGTDGTYSGSKALDSWYTPTTFDHPAGAIAPKICATNASGTCQPAGGSCQVQSIAPPAVSSSSNNLSITFANGNADFCLVTSDVGKYTISVRDDSNMSLPITGSGSTLTARPLALYFNHATQGGIANPKETTSSGVKFISAGDTFEGIVSAVLWTFALDPGYTGMPTVTPQNNATAWSDALLSSPPTFAWPTTLSVASVVNPSGGDGTLNSPVDSYSLAASAYTNGYAVLPANSLSIDNVGSFLLTETVSNYLNTSGTTVPAYSDVIGRFYLDHFELSSGTVSAACNGYTYMGQPKLGIAFTLRAENKNNGRATNYAMTPAVTLVAEDQGAGNTGYDLSSRISSGTGTWAADDYTVSASSATFSRPDTPGPITGGAENAAGPFDQLQIGVDVIDADGARIQGLDMRATTQGACTATADAATDCDAKVIGTTKIRLGRISLQNASGSELLDLPVPLTAEYWNGNSWVTNTEDSCTALIAPADGSGLRFQLANNGATTATLSNPLVSGDAGLSLSAPGVTHSGYVDITIDSPAWLDFKWDGVTDSDPISRATFGIYKGNSKFIYIRELY
jgi:MSHA biogenesis protein MshQ